MVVKEAGNKADHSPLFTIKVKNVWSYTSILPNNFMALYLIKHNFTALCLIKHKGNFSFTLTKRTCSWGHS
jgi:hypothetical protein